MYPDVFFSSNHLKILFFHTMFIGIHGDIFSGVINRPDAKTAHASSAEAHLQPSRGFASLDLI